MHNTKTRAVRPLKQAGFTLIELLIVIAIIGVLSAVAVPQYQKYVDRSEYTAEFSELASYSTLIDAELASDSTETQAENNIGADNNGEVDDSDFALKLAKYNLSNHVATLQTESFKYEKKAGSAKWECKARDGVDKDDDSLLPKPCQD